MAYGTGVILIMKQLYLAHTGILIQHMFFYIYIYIHTVCVCVCVCGVCGVVWVCVVCVCVCVCVYVVYEDTNLYNDMGMT